MCDQYGILVLAGWCCCDHWEKWQDWSPEDETIAAESLRDQLRRMERHPSLLDWMYGSDNPPPPKIEQMYLDVIKETEWPNPYHSSATAKATKLGGPTGVKMTGPYEYVAPKYWLLDTKFGGAHGFNTETSPGPSPPPDRIDEAHAARRRTGGPSIPGGIITRAAASSRTSTSSPTR